MDLLLSDPDDEGLWEGILLPPGAPFFRRRPAAPPPGPGQGQDIPLYYWKSLLIDGALGACAPAIGERCLRLALRAVGGGGEDEGEGRGEDDPSLVSSAVVLLRGLSRLARSVVVFWSVAE